MCNPVHEARPHFDQASAVIAPMVHRICNTHEDSGDFMEAVGLQCEGLVVGRKGREAALHEKANRIYSQLDSHGQCAMSLAQEKGASIWLTTVPMDEHAFCSLTGDFHDLICLRYGWKPQPMPSHWSDGEPFTMEHALSSNRGGYVSLRHNEVRDLLTDLLSDTCNKVTVEPHLQPVCGERFQSASAITADEARLNIQAGGFWGRRHEIAYFDVRVFNPHASSNCTQSLARIYRRREAEKRRRYGERVWGD